MGKHQQLPASEAADQAAAFADQNSPPESEAEAESAPPPAEDHSAGGPPTPPVEGGIDDAVEAETAKKKSRKPKKPAVRYETPHLTDPAKAFGGEAKYALPPPP